jgi:NAD(P)H dehydrogenase (quinone)
VNGQGGAAHLVTARGLGSHAFSKGAPAGGKRADAVELAG